MLGCAFPQNIVFRDTLENCPDIKNQELTTKYGIYEPNCGLENLYLSYGHDEYLYQVLRQNQSHRLPEKYWNIIRYHSFYPFHSGGEYSHLVKDSDKEIMKDIVTFNNFDLYSKEDDDFKLTPAIKDYYQELLKEYFPHELKW